MNPLRVHLEADLTEILGPSPQPLFRDIARPVSPHPLFSVVELPEDRSDFTRDDESTGV